jgi:hypothetical protein
MHATHTEYGACRESHRAMNCGGQNLHCLSKWSLEEQELAFMPYLTDEWRELGAVSIKYEQIVIRKHLRGILYLP